MSLKYCNYSYMYVLTPPLHIYIIPNPYLIFLAEYLHEARKMSKYIAVYPIHVYYYIYWKGHVVKPNYVN